MSFSGSASDVLLIQILTNSSHHSRARERCRKRGSERSTRPPNQLERNISSSEPFTSLTDSRSSCDRPLPIPRDSSSSNLSSHRYNALSSPTDSSHNLSFTKRSTAYPFSSSSSISATLLSNNLRHHRQRKAESNFLPSFSTNPSNCPLRPIQSRDCLCGKRYGSTSEDDSS